MALKKYQEKRKFDKTSEPKGKRRASSKKRIFVIQKHAASHLHYDFRLELGGTLLSWAVPKGPSLDPNVKRLAVHVEDHPIEYAKFHGVIPKGQYGAGTVAIWDKGTWESEDASPQKAYRAGRMHFKLFGKKCHGSWVLVRINKNDKTWLLMKKKDEYSKTKGNDILKDKQKTAPFPKTVAPELATLVDKIPAGKQWLHEVKFDGYRLLLVKKNGKTKLLTRNSHNWTNKFKKIAKIGDDIPYANIILDGELVVQDDKGLSNFQMLQNAIKQGDQSQFLYYVFDILYLDKSNLCQQPLLERKKILKTVIKQLKSKTLMYSDHLTGAGAAIFKQACKLGLEGIVSKNKDSTYQQRRTKQWLKTKCNYRQEFIIIGYTPPKGRRGYFGALLLATYNKKKQLVYHGRVGTGFTEATIKEIHAQLKKYTTKEMPFAKAPPASKQVTWLQPKLVGEVEFTEWTKDDILRHPSFKGIRCDKKPSQIRKERP